MIALEKTPEQLDVLPCAQSQPTDGQIGEAGLRVVADEKGLLQRRREGTSTMASRSPYCAVMRSSSSPIVSPSNGVAEAPCA